MIITTKTTLLKRNYVVRKKHRLSYSVTMSKSMFKMENVSHSTPTTLLPLSSMVVVGGSSLRLWAVLLFVDREQEDYYMLKFGIQLTITVEKIHHKPLNWQLLLEVPKLG